MAGHEKGLRKIDLGMLVMSTGKGPQETEVSPLQSIESSEFNGVVQIDHQKIHCMTATGYNQVLVMIDHYTKYAEAAPA